MERLVIADNRKANYNYTLLDEYQAGIVLKGWEIKSIRNHSVNMSDAYCTFENGVLILKNMHISEYKNADGHFGDMTPKRDRILLLKKQELRKLNKCVKIKGQTIIPVLMFINERGICKVNISLAVGKKTYDKSKSIKERDLEMEAKRNLNY